MEATNTNTPAETLADYALRVFAPFAMESVGLEMYAAELRDVPANASSADRRKAASRSYQWADRCDRQVCENGGNVDRRFAHAAEACHAASAATYIDPDTIAYVALCAHKARVPVALWREAIAAAGLAIEGNSIKAVLTAAKGTQDQYLQMCLESLLPQLA